MEEGARQARMFVDLATSETDALEQQHRLTNRAELYLAAGLPLDQLLTALRVSRATWYRRVDALRAHEIERSNAWDTRKGTHATHTAVAHKEAEPDGTCSLYILEGRPVAAERDNWDAYEVTAPGRDAADDALRQLGWARTIAWTRSSHLGDKIGWIATVERTEPEHDDA